jgi:hypothetical protein
MCEYACKNALRENSDIRPCSVYSVLGLLQLHFLPWAARYNTWLLIKLTPKDGVFSFPFLSTFPAFSCMACFGELPLTYSTVLSHCCYQQQICCQTQSEDQMFSVLLQQTNPLLVPGGAASHNPQSKVVVALQVNWSVTMFHALSSA